MKKLSLIILLILFVVEISLAEIQKEKIKNSYKLKDKNLIITNNGFLDEIWLCDLSLNNCELINRAFSFEALAYRCDSLNGENIYFAKTKDYYFQGGWHEESPLKIFDLKGNILGIAPDLNYAKSFCEFY